MIITETVLINEKEFIRNYSSDRFMIERDGIRYTEAIDPVDSGRTYIETDEIIPELNEEAEAADYEEAL